MEDTMGPKKLAEYKEKLLALKTEIMNRGFLNSTEDLHISSEDLPDEADLASNIINQEVAFSIKNRELEKLKAIDLALYRIQEGTYGLCEDCGEEIGSARLNRQPWTDLCITHAEEREREIGYALRA